MHIQYCEQKICLMFVNLYEHIVEALMIFTDWWQSNNDFMK